MKTFFVFFLGIIYLLLAKAVESILFNRLYFFIGLGLIIAGSVHYMKERNRYLSRLDDLRDASEQELLAIPHTQCILAEDYLSALLLDEPTNTLYLASREDLAEELIKKEIPFNKIYEVAIVEDEIFIARTSNHLISGSLLEDQEIEVEEIDEDDPEYNTVSHLALKIVADNLSDPILEYVFLNQDEPISREEEEYVESIELCEKWYQRISVIIKRYELERVPIRHWQ
ncbi:hypothetical protein [Lysinibacillus sp. NPDC047702]|uniref:hypothetical protein n=1 Tax=unclassified Lysinibacillus TaxID=2636778 RepID=UPI003D0132C8